MNTKQIDEALRRILNPNQVNFLGVFPADLLPKVSRITRFPACLVANNEPHGEEGEHWIAFYYEDADSLDFFDSYGLPISAYHFPSQSHTPLMSYNSKLIQCPKSNVCGQHCIYFLYFRSRRSGMPTITSKFSPSNLRSNDLYVARTVNRLVHKRYPFRICASETPFNFFQISHSLKNK